MELHTQTAPTSLLPLLMANDHQTNNPFNDVLADIKYHLENILNTRLAETFDNVRDKEVERSLIAYGIKDFSHYYFNHETTQQQLCQHLQQKITQFEPRLSDVTVNLQPSDVEISRLLHLRIEATVNTQPATLAVFESSLDFTNQLFYMQ